MFKMIFDYSHYQTLLEALLETRIFVTYPDRNAKNDPRVVLRHDIDRGLEFLGPIPIIEQEKGIQATYFIQVASDFYNPFASSQRRVIEGLKNMNHRLGLHFDCLKDDGEIHQNELQARIHEEMGLMEACFGVVDAVSFHQPSKAVIENKVKIAQINTYDKGDMRGFDYLSDSAQQWSKTDPLEWARGRPDASLQVLIHPCLWTEKGISFTDMAVAAIRAKAQSLYEYERCHARGIFPAARCCFKT